MREGCDNGGERIRKSLLKFLNIYFKFFIESFIFHTLKIARGLENQQMKIASSKAASKFEGNVSEAYILKKRYIKLRRLSKEEAYLKECNHSQNDGRE